jgi:hypothetical protein
VTTETDVTRPSDTTIVVALGTAPHDGATVAALRLADAAVERGHRVAVYAYGEGARVGAEDAATAQHVAGWLRRGVHGGRASWVVDGTDPRAGDQVAGVVSGDGSDLWRFVREGDVVLGVTA